MVYHERTLKNYFIAFHRKYDIRAAHDGKLGCNTAYSNILKQWITLNARPDWLVKLRISFSIYLRVTREKMASLFASVTSQEITQINDKAVPENTKKAIFTLLEQRVTFLL